MSFCILSQKVIFMLMGMGTRKALVKSQKEV